jgi:hypothetical protein
MNATPPPEPTERAGTKPSLKEFTVQQLWDEVPGDFNHALLCVMDGIGRAHPVRSVHCVMHGDGRLVVMVDTNDLQIIKA